MRLVFDIETNGLLHQLDRIHCIHAADIDTGEFYRFGPLEIGLGVTFLERAAELVAHNGFWFDYVAIRKLYPNFRPTGYIRDSLAESRLVYSNLTDIDFTRLRKGRGSLPKHMIGSHSLEAWGHRLGQHKGDYAKEMKAQGLDPWAAWNPLMDDYCRQDVVVTLELVRRLESKQYSRAALYLENRISELMALQESNGFFFREEAAVQLYAQLCTRRDEVHRELVKEFGWWNQPTGVKTPTRTVRFKDPIRADQTEGAPYSTFVQVQFNPSSRQHIAKRLKELYGWEATEFTDNGQPKIDETVLATMDNPHAKLLAESFLLEKRIGQIAEGANGWLRLVKHGYIHGRVNPNGAVTGRATHSYPNVAQVPSGRAEYGKECRELFAAPPGWFLLGSDASGLELRCLGHFMARYDGGAYIKILLEGDIHWANVLALGLVPPGTVRDKHNDHHEWARGVAKTFIYAFLYGAGDEKIGSIVLPKASKAEQAKKGKQLKKKFLNSFPALKKLLNAVKEAAKSGSLKGLDGRKVYVRSAHAALNTLLQSAGALVCKQWLVCLEDNLQGKGLIHGWKGDYAFCAWVHDEVQIACKTQAIAELIGQACKEAMATTAEIFNFRCPLEADFAIGKSWADTH